MFWWWGIASIVSNNKSEKDNKKLEKTLDTLIWVGVVIIIITLLFAWMISSC